tara:strand:+ start:773 stop:1189 length:417 start_codon:yes stop_codon:yes gene_type:complete
MDPNRIFTGMLILLFVFLAFCMKPAHAKNEYLQYDNHCQGPTLEPYIEYSKTDNTGTGTSGSGYEDDRGTVGVRLRIPLTTTCGKDYRKVFNENALLRQQLELLKMCSRYKDLELPDQFAMVREKCDGIKRKPEKKEK